MGGRCLSVCMGAARIERLPFADVGPQYLDAAVDSTLMDRCLQNAQWVGLIELTVPL